MFANVVVIIHREHWFVGNSEIISWYLIILTDRYEHNNESEESDHESMLLRYNGEAFESSEDREEEEKSLKHSLQTAEQGEVKVAHLLF